MAATLPIDRDPGAVAPPGPGRHVPALDGLRGVAIALVVAHHVGNRITPAWAAWTGGGFLGVDLFFVLSGFLITGLLLDEHRRGDDTGAGRRRPVRLSRFYGRRALRLVPALVAFSMTHALIAVLADLDAELERNSILAALTYTTNLAQLHGVRVSLDFAMTWSLAVEEHFYLVWPPLLLAVLRFAPRRLALAVVGLVVAGATWRWMLVADYGQAWPRVYIRSDARIDTLLLGALLAVAVRRWRPPSPAVAAGCGIAGTAVVVGTLAVAERTENWVFEWGLVLFTVGVVGTILGATGSAAFARLLDGSVLRWLGTRSYALYLWHQTAVSLTTGAFPDLPQAGQVAVALGVSAIASEVSTRAVEQGFRALGRRSDPPPSVSTAATRAVIGVAMLVALMAPLADAAASAS